MVPLTAIWHHVTHVAMTSHDQESHIAPHFHCLDLVFAVVPLMMPLASCDVELVPMA